MNIVFLPTKTYRIWLSMIQYFKINVSTIFQINSKIIKIAIKYMNTLYRSYEFTKTWIQPVK